MALNFYLDKAKRMLDIERDAALARRIEITPQELNRARKKGWLPDEPLARLATVSGIPLEELLVAREASKEGKFQAVWSDALERLRQATHPSLFPTEAPESLYYRK